MNVTTNLTKFIIALESPCDPSQHLGNIISTGSEEEETVRNLRLLPSVETPPVSFASMISSSTVLNSAS